MKICILNERFLDGGLSNITKVVGKELSKKNDVFYYSMLNNVKNSKKFDDQLYTTQSVFSGKSIFEKIYRKFIYFYFDKLNNKKVNFNLLYNNKIEEFSKFCNKESIDIVILSGGLLTSFIPKIKESSPSLKFIAWQHNEAEIYFKKYYKN
ncbi:MAG TPA: hypothetical protein DEQ26_15870, partial [Flavobacteriaceae bacterium]|nr:hypothetical protein [Flavobacteriaceae bacterium]